MCRMYFNELQAVCPCCTLNTTILAKKRGMSLMQSSIFISKNSGEVNIALHSLPQQFKTLFVNAHTYVFVVILYVSKKV